MTLTFDDLLIPCGGKVSRILLEKVTNHNLAELTTYEPLFLAGIQAQAYEISLEEAWGTAREQMREKTLLACRNQASSSQIRNFSMSLDFADESWRYILLPFYLAVYPYEGKLYQVLINGQTAAIAGQRPVDWGKVWLVIAALLAPGLMLGLAGLITLPIAGIGAPIGLGGFILLLLGVIAAIVLFLKAQSMDDA